MKALIIIILAVLSSQVKATENENINIAVHFAECAAIVGHDNIKLESKFINAANQYMNKGLIEYSNIEMIGNADIYEAVKENKNPVTAIYNQMTILINATKANKLTLFIENDCNE
ncbi:hypothetical protein [Herbiconiux daphne]|uniref:Uncharacterized protein n=1 Tax=Herbiconiux daphne TaxID=2970914 RepID=A0ABT2HBF2_9MICO|nr:hypothetical protein [Herbiconiux daphne]MCS5737237.1 hypothetical protein [Herbiconiux daphne]